MTTGWTEPSDFPDIVRDLQKRITRLERRPGAVSIGDTLGPGLASYAVGIFDWNAPEATLNGFYYTFPGALNSPDEDLSWTGQTIAKDDGTGMQQVWNTDGAYPIYYVRTYQPNALPGGPPVYDVWKKFATDSGLIEGDMLDPDTFPGIYVPTDPPATSPTVTISGTVDALIIETTAIAPGTVLEYHLSVTESFTPDSTTLFSETASTIVVATMLPDGTPLSLDTTYYVKVLAKNDAGSATGGYSAETQGQLDPEKASEIAVATLSAGGILTGRIDVGVAYIDADEGIVVPQPDGGAIRFPVDGVTAAQITAHLIARSLDVEDNANFYGLSQLLGTLRLANGISNPTTPVSVSRNWPDPIQMHFGFIPDQAITGIGLCDNDTGDRWYTASNFGGLLLSDVNKVDGGGENAYVTGTNVSMYGPDGGITRVGSFFYTLGKDINRSLTNWYVYKINMSGAKVDEWLFSTSIANDPKIGSDGSNLLIAWVNNSGNLIVRNYTTAGVQNSQVNLGAPVGSATVVRAVQGGDFDLGAGRLFIADNTSTVYCYNSSTGARVSSKDFPVAGSSKVRGLWWDTFATPDKFYSYDNLGRVWEYATGVTQETDTDVAYTWFDDVDPDHESMVGSSTVTFARPARTLLEIEAPPAPQVDVVGSDDIANQIRIYAAPTGSSLRRQATLAVGTRTLTIDVLDTGSSNPPASNGFEGVGITPGVVESAADDGAGNPLTEFHGDGSFGLLGDNIWDSGDLTPTGSWAGRVHFSRIGGTVFAEGYIDRDDNFGTGQTTVSGITIPTWARPAANLATPPWTGYGTTNKYRYNFNADGTFEVQREGIITTFMTFSHHYPAA